MEEVILLVLQRHARQILGQHAVIVKPDAWPEVQGVASWLEGIWANLVGNALKHGREGIRIELGWAREESGFRFWVNDDGEGIPPENVANLFQPFHLLHKLDSRKGLGLSIVQRLAELQGGKCGYSPGPLGGSSFHFTLPADQDSAPASAGKFTNRIPNLSASAKDA
jgi:signal transduction histidine kinase